MIQNTQAPELLQLPIAELHESPLNPRRHFAADALAELSSSIKKVGILTPLMARPNSKGYELAAGHRRLRAAKMAGVITAPVLVRPMDDATFLEVMTVDNLQRDDLHPLEEAQGFRSLMENSVGYNVAKISERTGRSVAYVYDRLKLLRLIPLAQELFLEDRFTVAHAIILARLAPDLQEIATDPNTTQFALFVRDHGTLFDGVTSHEDDELLDEETDEAPATLATRYKGTKAASVREFQKWVDTHVRFDLDGEDVPMLFPDTELALSQADAAAAKVVQITYQQQVNDMAKIGDRIVGPRSWRRADPICDHAMLGVVVVGAHRGEAFEICTAKKKCLVHWGDEIKAARAVDRADAVCSERTASEDHWKVRQEKERLEREEWEAAQPAIEEAFATAIKKASVKVGGPLVSLIIERQADNDAIRLLMKPKTAEDVLRVLGLSDVLGHCGFYMRHELKKDSKIFGVDLAAILKAQKQTSAKAAPAKKKGGK